MRIALVVSGPSSRRPGPTHDIGTVDDIDAGLVLAADSGWYDARRLGVVPHELIGDLDSVRPDDVDDAVRLGVVVTRFPTDKDATDLELALDRAVGWGAERIVVVGRGGGRLDHQLGELLLLASPRYAGVVVEARLGGSTIHPVRGGPRSIDGRPGGTLSILPLAGPATVTTTGLRWPLTAEQLDPGSTRGISNEFEGTTATVGTEHGVVLVVVPEEEMS